LDILFGLDIFDKPYYAADVTNGTERRDNDGAITVVVAGSLYRPRDNIKHNTGKFIFVYK